jgi:hypothetical protein
MVEEERLVVEKRKRGQFSVIFVWNPLDVFENNKNKRSSDGAH